MGRSSPCVGLARDAHRLVEVAPRLVGVAARVGDVGEHAEQLGPVLARGGRAARAPRAARPRRRSTGPCVGQRLAELAREDEHRRHRIVELAPEQLAPRHVERVPQRAHARRAGRPCAARRMLSTSSSDERLERAPRRASPACARTSSGASGRSSSARAKSSRLRPAGMLEKTTRRTSGCAMRTPRSSTATRFARVERVERGAEVDAAGAACAQSDVGRRVVAPDGERLRARGARRAGGARPAAR